jgi:hypothetical protein
MDACHTVSAVFSRPVLEKKKYTQEHYQKGLLQKPSRIRSFCGEESLLVDGVLIRGTISEGSH